MKNIVAFRNVNTIAEFCRELSIKYRDLQKIKQKNHDFLQFM